MVGSVGSVQPDQGLLHAVNLDDCEFSGDGDEFNRLKTRYAPTDGDVVVEDNKLRPGLRMHLHRDGLGATFTVDHRVNTWLTRGRTGSATVSHVLASDCRQRMTTFDRQAMRYTQPCC